VKKKKARLFLNAGRRRRGTGGKKKGSFHSENWPGKTKEGCRKHWGGKKKKKQPYPLMSPHWRESERLQVKVLDPQRGGKQKLKKGKMLDS